MKRGVDDEYLANRAFGIFILNSSKYFTNERFDEMKDDELLSLITSASNALKKRKVEDVYKSSLLFKKKLAKMLKGKWVNFIEAKFREVPDTCPYHNLLFTQDDEMRFVFSSCFDVSCYIRDDWNEPNMELCCWLRNFFENAQNDYLTTSKQHFDCEKSVMQYIPPISDILKYQTK